ncbi:MAG: hypothetical protein VYE64_03055 [Planctomycetota bacterium]|nr:hypothetical protein [Planctomycetota bacterium]
MVLIVCIVIAMSPQFIMQIAMQIRTSTPEQQAKSEKLVEEFLDSKLGDRQSPSKRTTANKTNDKTSEKPDAKTTEKTEQPQQNEKSFQDLLFQLFKNDFPRSTPWILFYLVIFILQVYFSLGKCFVCLKVARGETPKISDLFSQGRNLLAGFIAGLILFVGIWLGFLLLIIPGILLMLACYLTPWFIVDQNMSPLRAIGQSISATRGSRGRLFLYWLTLVVSLIATCCCFPVTFILSIVFLVGNAHIYLALTGETIVSTPIDKGAEGDVTASPS